MIKQMDSYILESATTVKKAFYSNLQAPIKYKYDEILASYTDGKITMQLRTLIQSQANSQHAAIDPPNHLAIEEKIKYYATEDSKTWTEKCAEFKLQTPLESTLQNW